MSTSRFAASFAAAIAALVTACTAAATSTEPSTQPDAAGDPAPAESAAGGSQPVAGEPDLMALSQCMRDNGIADFPDPSANGLNIGGLGIDRDSPQFVAAQEACNSLRPQPGAGGPGGSASGGDPEWEKVVPGGDCVCADGSEFAFWERRADPTKVVLYLEGGGACYDAATCAFTSNGESELYDWNLSNETPGLGGGIFDFDRADNPFADYSFVWVTLCTGDVYLGDVTREYSPDLTVEHNGFVNGTAALGYIAENYRDAAQVVVLGKTAGSVAAPVYGGLVADLLPDTQVTVLGAQSGGFPDEPDFNAEILGERWGAYDNMPGWEVNDGLTARDWGPTRFWIQAGLHDPGIVMARFDYAFDQNAADAIERLFGLDGSNLLGLIDANEAAIEDAGVVQHSYTAPGDGHGILEFDTFYELEVSGVRLVDWVDALIAGEPLGDVRCDDCQAP
jgi:hypothetical protein